MGKQVMNEVNRHYHHDYIVAWAKGAKIQKYTKWSNGRVNNEGWRDEPNPDWHEDSVYRLKPVYKTEELNITLVFKQFYIERADEGKGNCLITYNVIDEQITDISMVK